MAFDGSGNFTRLFNWQQDAANNINITASRVDAEDTGFASGLSLAVTRDGQGKMTADFLPATDNTLNLGSALKRWNTFNGIPAAQVTGGALNNIVQYGGGTGVADNTTAINAAITAISAAGGGILLFPSGNYAHAGTITLASGVILFGYGATLTYSGGTKQVSSPTTGVLVKAGLMGLNLNTGNTSTVMLDLWSPFQCVFQDLTFYCNSLTNICILLQCNTSGPKNAAGNWNPAYCKFDNVLQELVTGTNGCGYFIVLNGVSSVGGVVTLNTFHNCNAEQCSVIGIDMRQWCDSNYFSGLTRLGLNGNASPANAIGLALSSTNAGGGGVYCENFEFLAIDCFGLPAVDNRVGIQANYPQGVRNINVNMLEFGPAGASAMNLSSVNSCYINQAPRGVTAYNQFALLGTNLGVGQNGATNVVVIAGNSGQASGGTQYVYYAQGSGGNFGTPGLVASYGCQPGLTSSVGPYTVTQVAGYQVVSAANGTNATASNVYGFWCSDQTLGTNSNVGMYLQLTAGTGKFSILTGTAQSQFGGPVSVNGASPPAQVTGWGTPTGPAVQINYAGASASLAQTSAAVAKIIADLKAFGLYAA